MTHSTVSINDPFQDVRDKRMSELDAEQRDRAGELWLREQLAWMPQYHIGHYETLFRIIDRLRQSQ